MIGVNILTANAPVCVSSNFANGRFRDDWNGWSVVRLRSPVEELEDTSGGSWNGKWYIVYMRRGGTRA